MASSLIFFAFMASAMAALVAAAAAAAAAAVRPVGGIIPGDISPGTVCGMMWEFSGDVTLWDRFGGLPGLELALVQSL